MAPVYSDVLQPVASKQCRSVGLRFHNESLAIVVLAVVLVDTCVLCHLLSLVVRAIEVPIALV